MGWGGAEQRLGQCMAQRATAYQNWRAQAGSEDDYCLLVPIHIILLLIFLQGYKLRSIIHS